MTDVLSIALSGLNAATTRVNAAASNIANANTSGAREGTDGPAPYTPVDVVDSSVNAHGVKSTVVNRDPAEVPAYEPDASYADSQGFVATPNVDLGTEIISMKAAAQAYEANLAVVNTANQMEKELFNRFDKTV